MTTRSLTDSGAAIAPPTGPKPRGHTMNPIRRITVTTTTATPTRQSSTQTTEIALQPVTLSVAEPYVRRDEAAYEALGILEVMYEHGNINPIYRDLCGFVIAKYREARRDITRGLIP